MAVAAVLGPSSPGHPAGVPITFYVAAARLAFKSYQTYAVATLAGLFANLVFGFLRSGIMFAAYENASRIGGWTLSQALTYVWLTQGLLAIVQIYGSTELASRIHSGDVAVDLSRPTDLQMTGLAKDLGRGAYHLLYRGVPPVVVGFAMFGLTPPGSLMLWIALGLSLVLAVTVSFAFRFLYNVLGFWLIDTRGVHLASVIAINALSGFIIPVRFFPDWLQVVAGLSPFPSMVQTPVEVFIGQNGNVEAILGQAMWAVALLLGTRVLLDRAKRRAEIQGG